ncbi:actin-domain-containing protein [Lipomyces tetrasporus]|uniref:Actin-domain-containing protein n=1 Tax=Lipomyces tetrasporus TaxID=54092 RepID=A0AAD7VVA6_9ASCO|nr:actin-domain-containing protein [Lipomyces tetrasporus]KAJ8102025.1 actin-domain-containing protein [Lipomyces tetrasporus]
MPPFRDEVVFVITTGSQTTRVQYGLPESLTPAQKAFPTRVYNTVNGDGKVSFSLEGAESDAIYPIRRGEIRHMEALLYLIETCYRTTTNAQTDSPFAPILLTCNSEWQPKQIEEIITYMFKKVHVPAITIIPEALATLYAYGLQIACVVNVGEDKTEITPIIDFNIVESAQAVVEIGGKDINIALQSLLPKLQPYQIEELKKSPIYEVLSDKSMSFFGEPSAPATSSGDDEGVIDVAAIVADGNAREILAQREQKKSSKQSEQKNSEMARNSFIDSKGQKVEVGTERFLGTEDMIERLAHEIGNVIGKLDDIARRGDCWENIILVGGPTAIKGFVDAVLLSLQEHFLITRGTTYSELPSGLNTPGYGTPPATPAVYGQTLGHGQVPTTIRITKMADYFIGWKGHTWEDAPFLGSQIAAKQIFTPGIASIDGAYISREDFAERGAREIWNLGLF